MLSDSRKDVGIYFKNRKIGVKEHEVREGYIWVCFGRFSIVACYVSPNINIESFNSKIDEIMGYIERKGQ